MSDTALSDTVCRVAVNDVRGVGAREDRADPVRLALIEHGHVAAAEQSTKLRLAR
jgi:hypothetical protein